jgi:hypothetical protein
MCEKHSAFLTHLMNLIHEVEYRINAPEVTANHGPFVQAMTFTTQCHPDPPNLSHHDLALPAILRIDHSTGELYSLRYVLQTTEFSTCYELRTDFSYKISDPACEEQNSSIKLLFHFTKLNDEQKQAVLAFNPLIPIIHYELSTSQLTIAVQPIIYHYQIETCTTSSSLLEIDN